MVSKANGNGKSNGRGKNGKKPAARKKKAASPYAEKQQPKQRGRLENIEPHQWPPGQSGNPKGRPKGPTVTTLLKQRLAEAASDADGKPLYNRDGERMTRLDLLVEEVIQRAIKGVTTDLVELLARIDPKPKQGDGNVSLDITVGIGEDRDVPDYTPPLGVNPISGRVTGLDDDAGD